MVRALKVKGIFKQAPCGADQTAVYWLKCEDQGSTTTIIETEGIVRQKYQKEWSQPVMEWRLLTSLPCLSCPKNAWLVIWLHFSIPLRFEILHGKLIISDPTDSTGKQWCEICLSMQCLLAIAFCYTNHRIAIYIYITTWPLPLQVTIYVLPSH